MTELETIQRAKMYMEKLANGINPIDGSVIPEEDVVNNVRLSRCFFYVADVLRQVIENGGIQEPKPVKKQPFALPMSGRTAFAYSREPITASEIVKRINALIDQQAMARFSVTALLEWLLCMEMLEIVSDPQGRLPKRPTPRGQALGIREETRMGMNGAYMAVVYSEEAQHFIMDNLDAVLEFAKVNKENQGRPWDPEQDRQLVELYRQNAPITEIAASLKRNTSAIRSRLKKLGIIQ